MKELLEYIITRKQTPIEEYNFKRAFGTAALAGALLMNTPTNVDAKPQTSITQAEKQINMDKLLNAIREVESSGGSDTRTRYEPGVERQLRSRFDKLNKHTQEAIKKYGYKAIASSYGAYQLLASTAYDIGFTGDLEDLKNEEVSKKLVTKLIHNLINSSKTKTVEDVISAYNAGLGGIGKNPGYISKVLKYYKE
jgi:hypothetical protein